LKFVFPKFVLWIFCFYFYIFDSLPISSVEASSRHVQGKGGERMWTGRSCIPSVFLVVNHWQNPQIELRTPEQKNI
jgi:hypothetical protein